MPPTKDELEGLTPPEALDQADLEGLSDPGELDKSLIDKPILFGVTGRDVTRGAGMGAGATLGAQVGTALGTAAAPFTGGLSIPIGAGLGGFVGGAAGDLLAEKTIDIGDAALTPGASLTDAAIPTGEEVLESGVGSTLNMTLPFIGGKLAKTGMGQRVVQGIDRIGTSLSSAADKLLVGKNQLLRSFRPVDKDFNLSIRGRPVDETVDEVFQLGYFNDVKTADDFYETVTDAIGSKEKIGYLANSLDVAGKSLDANPNSKIKYSDLKRFLDDGDGEFPGFNEFKKKYLNPDTDSPLTEEGADAIKAYDSALEQIKDSITAPFREELSSLEKAFQKEVSKPTANLDALQAKYLPKILELRQIIADPDVSFAGRYQAQKALDSKVANAFLKESNATPELTNVEKFLANGFRKNIKDQALLIDPVNGAEFVKLKHHYELLAEMEPLALKALKASKLSPLPAEVGPVNQLGFKPIPGMSSVPLLGRVPIPAKIKRALTPKELFEQGVKQVNQYRKLFPNLNPEPFEKNLLDSAGRLVMGTASVGLAQNATANAVSLEPKISRPSLTKLDNTKQSVKDFITIGLAQGQGIEVEQLSSGIPQQMFEQLSLQAEEEVAQLFQGVDQAVTNYGADSTEAQIALSQLTASVPHAFSPPKSGIAGEISVGTKRYLPMLEQRTPYANKLRQKYKNGKLDVGEVSGAMHKLNSDGEVTIAID